jgi:hypothetical protein
MNFKTTFNKLNIILAQIIWRQYYGEDEKLFLGRLFSELNKNKEVNSLKDIEFKVFSQWGDDGIIQFLISNLVIGKEIFIEFGVEDYRESNTRFLMMNNNWSGLVMDASSKNINRIRNSEYYWKYELTAVCAFIDRENINNLINSAGITGEIGLLHIDLDGNDYWIWDAIKVIYPTIVIVEYRSVFGPDRAITIPYQDSFSRNKAHFSNLYYGASLKAFCLLANNKGYGFIGCNSAGNNAYFVRRDKLNDKVKEITLEAGFIVSKFRESRDKKGNLTYLTGKDRLKAIEGFPVYNIVTDEIEEL